MRALRAADYNNVAAKTVTERATRVGGAFGGGGAFGAGSSFGSFGK